MPEKNLTDKSFGQTANLSETNETANIRFGYIRSLDGVRAVAVLLVFCFHASLIFPFFKKHLQGGFLGVDVFFVLSGFLITSILIREFEETGKIDLKKFYLRRFLRLMPAFWLFLAVMYLFADRLFLPAASAQLYSNHNFIYSFFYLTNWERALDGSEIAGLIGHTWSLAIEEQFYLLWASLLFLLLTKFNRKAIISFTAGLILATAFFRALRWEANFPVDYLYNAFDTRMDSLLIGCLVSQILAWKIVPKAFLESRRFDAAAYICLSAAALIIFNLPESYNSAFLYLGGLTIFAAAVGVVIAWFAITAQRPNKNFLQKTLESRPLNWLGKTSYGFYLWHSISISFVFPLFNKPLARLLAAFALSLLLTSISYYLVELQFLKLKKRIR